MKKRIPTAFFALCLISLTACGQNEKQIEKTEVTKEISTVENEPHQYGGWYCPDNLNGFAPVDIRDWVKVPAVNGRLGTKEDSENGATLIVVDTDKYPKAFPLDIIMPKLANYYNDYSKRDELVIVIQAMDINGDSIVGFRYLNGGNGSSRLTDVIFLSDDEINEVPTSKFVSHTIKIGATKKQVLEFIQENKFEYENKGTATSEYGGDLFGNFYIQNDYDKMQYNEKFLLIESERLKNTELQIVCGPFTDDYRLQNENVLKWAQKIKEMSEK